MVAATQSDYLTFILFYRVQKSSTLIHGRPPYSLELEPSFQNIVNKAPTPTW